MSELPQGEINCPHCHATPQTQDVRLIVANEDGRVVAIRHTQNCVDYTERPGETPTA